jgi:hypothetical protein
VEEQGVARGLHFSNRWYNLSAGLLTPLNDAYNSGCGIKGVSVSGRNTYQKWVNDSYTKAVSSTVFGREYRRKSS